MTAGTKNRPENITAGISSLLGIIECMQRPQVLMDGQGS